GVGRGVVVLGSKVGFGVRVASGATGSEAIVQPAVRPATAASRIRSGAVRTPHPTDPGPSGVRTRHREQDAGLLAPDHDAPDLCEIGAGGDRRVEVAVRRAQATQLQALLRVAVRLGREIHVEVRPVADREVLEPDDMPTWFDLDDAGSSTTEVEVVGP